MSALSPASLRAVVDLIADEVMRQSLRNAGPDLTLDQGERILMLCRSAPRGREAFHRALGEIAARKPGAKP